MTRGRGEGAAAPASVTVSTASSAGTAVRLHGVLDLLFAAAYAWVGFSLAPSRVAWFRVALALVIALLGAAGVALLLRLRVARTVALIAHSVLLLLCATTVAALVASAAYLRGIYGPLGEGMAALTLVAGALVVELCGLLPIFQIRLLLRDDVRRHLVRGAPAPPGSDGVAAAG